MSTYCHSEFISESMPHNFAWILKLVQYDKIAKELAQ